MRLLTGWGKILHQFGFYDYYGHYSMFGPWGVVHKMREDLPALRELGGTFLMIEAQPNFGIDGLNLYIAGRLAWDTQADVDALLQEYFTKLYGPAADPMRRFWLATERHYALARPGSHAAQRVTADPELWAELDACLKEAELAVANAHQRFKDRVTLNRDGFELGRRLHEIDAKANRREQNPDYAAALALAKQHAPWIQMTRTKYGTADPYWPQLLASYFYAELDEKLAELEAKAKGPAGGAPPAP
jgi:hypothetical protein